MAQFEANLNILTTADSGWRDPYKTLWSIFHTTQNGDSTKPEDVAKWQLDRNNDSSYHLLFGTDGRTVRSNDDNYSPWSTGMPGNRLGNHASAIGYAARSKADWLKFPKQIEALARWAAHEHLEYKRPLVWLSIEDIRGQKKAGFTSHANYYQAIGKAQGMDFRSDPGVGFPHDIILKRAHEIAYPAMHEKAKETPPVTTPDNRSTEDLILDQLAGFPWEKWQGWPQLGGRSLVDGLGAIGAHLKIEGFKDTKE